MAKAKTFFDYHEEIEQLKLDRIAAWRQQMPADVGTHVDGDQVAEARTRKAAQSSENHPDVVALEVKIRQLRAEQLEAHDEPTVEEWNAYHAKGAQG